jgi:hypothetical protein
MALDGEKVTSFLPVDGLASMRISVESGAFEKSQTAGHAPKGPAKRLRGFVKSLLKRHPTSVLDPLYRYSGPIVYIAVRR